MSATGTFVEFMKQELEDALKNKTNVLFNYHDLLSELNRRFNIEHNEAFIEQTRRMAKYTFWTTISTMVSTIIAVIALRMAVLK